MYVIVGLGNPDKKYEHTIPSQDLLCGDKEYRGC